MIKHVVFLLFLYGIKSSSGSGSFVQEGKSESEGVSQNGIKKNEVGANGLEANLDKITRNFQNPVLEYILQKNSERTNGPPQKGVLREIRHSQTLLIPSTLRSFLPEFFINQLPQFEAHKKPVEEGTRNPDDSPFVNFWDFLKNKTQAGGNKIQENVVSSPVLHLNKNSDKVSEESTRIQMYPAVAVVIHTFNKDGTLKNSVTHFQPDFNSFKSDATENIAIKLPGEKNESKNSKITNNSQYTINNLVRDRNSYLSGNHQPPRQGISWPLANYFPIVVNDPFLSVYNAFATSMYNAVSSMVEYGPEADICSKEKNQIEGNISEKEKVNRKVMNQQQSGFYNKEVPAYLDHYRKEAAVTDTDVFDEITMQSESFKQTNVNKKQNSQIFDRKRRDATSIFIKSRDGDTVDITLEEPTIPNNGQKVVEETDLILRKGGVAIAGPGGAATAYTGGTAIVGPYGTVYKSPEGTAILGPFSKVVNITDDTSFEEILKMHKEMLSQNQVPGGLNFRGKDVGFKSYQNFFSYMTNLPMKFEVKPQPRSFVKNRPKIMQLKEEGIVKAIEEIKKAEFRRVVQDSPYEERTAKNNETTLVFRPKSKAEAGRNGVALSAPTSHAILYPGQKTNIYFEPESVASAGPSGFAHAYSDLFVTYVTENTTTVYELTANTPDERARSFSQVLVNTPPLSTVLRPPQQEPRQFLGYADKKRKTKPSKPIKEEGSSEEVGEEHEEENISQSPENANEAVAISPPPEGASVAEAKPIGLAIAGPGGVAASKPQGTAVAGPGGLAIARPVGTAIAGVEVEGSVPIGGQQKNKKKPKQEQEQTETDLHYVGGLTGPIGNPQPKEFADSVYYKTMKETEGNNIQDKLFLHGRPNTNGFQFKLGQQYGKYGLIPMFSNPVEGEGRLAKRTDFPIFFHGLLGNNGQGYEQFQNYQTQF